MKPVVTALTLATLAVLSSVAHADAPPTGSIDKAASFAAGNAGATAAAVGLGLGTIIAVTVDGAEGGGSTATSTATTPAQ